MNRAQCLQQQIIKLFSGVLIPAQGTRDALLDDIEQRGKSYALAQLIKSSAGLIRFPDCQYLFRVDGNHKQQIEKFSSALTHTFRSVEDFPHNINGRSAENVDGKFINVNAALRRLI